MKPLFVLLVVFGIALFVLKLMRGGYEVVLSARIAMAAMLLFTAIGHIKFADGMAMMLPAFIPQKLMMVYATGLIEVAAAIGLLMPNFKELTGWCLIAFFILVLPANIHAALHQVDYQNASLNGPGTSYLWFRIPLQFVFIFWVYLSCIKY